MPITRADAEAMDRQDPLARHRDAFAPLSGLYLDGHSLGPPTKAALARVDRTAREAWAGRLVGAWNDTADGGWIDLPARAAAKIARLIGAAPEDVIVGDSVSVNLFKLAAALLKPGKTIAVYEGEFPTDAYVMAGLARLAGGPLLRLKPGEALAGRMIDVLIKSAVDYRTAEVTPLAALEAEAREAGAAIIWDLSHAAGLLKLDLARDGVRFAVGCGYKYLNGGPGAPAFLYCRGAEAAGLLNPVSGWFGHAAPFDFAPDYAPAPGAKRFLAGTPPILSLSALDAALDLFDGLDMGRVEAKARALGEVFLMRIAGLGIEIAGVVRVADPPLAPPFQGGEKRESVPPLEKGGLGGDQPRVRLPNRGGHVGLKHEHGYAIIRCLIERGVCGDFRAPDLMRFGFSPLFLRYVDAFDAAEALVDVMTSGAWRAPRFHMREKVT